ncbi:serine hydrolase domain-containing protein [Aquimarina litoralis]|uniref:serine hydrolase domain-containing protein n=1 Tax=Aquimarina litoralis TaxID=584605 RepID=UPI001C56A933|nr:serine hydrolase [Aquimarina litoralis]MBW1294014.1 serine hydrolase [Aquimarina litoralis]
MKIIKILLKGFVAIIVLCVLLLYIFDYDYILKGVRVVYMTGHTTAYIDDYTYFDNHTIEKAGKPIPWKLHANYNKATPTETLNRVHEEMGTVAFMIIKNDEIWYENYAEGYGTTSKTNSFSMAKSITTALLGKAIMEGHIKSLDQPIGDFLPSFSEGLAAKVTVGDLSSMSSGLNWTEHYTSPFSITARAYYDPELREVMNGLEIVDEPGKEFVYLSGNTQLLGMVIEKATGKTLSKYLSESFWKPMGMEEDALWQVDSEESGMEKSYCCIASNARDFARFGVLFKNDGKFGGKQILPKDFVKLATKKRFENDEMYGYGFWLSDHLGKDIFVMRGILGQYVITIPQDDVIIVRLGHHRGLPEGSFSEDFFIYVEEAYKMLENAS